jgi:hypothetical protein
MQRGQTIMQAVLAVSKIKVDRSMEMLLEIEPPRPRADGLQVPDLRAGIATMVFQRQWHKNGLAGLDAIQSTARRMGESGYYPYMALAPLIRQAANKNTERAAALTQDGLNFLSSRQSTELENQHVAAFLRNAADFMPAALMKETIEKLVKEAQSVKDSSLQMQAQIADDKGNRAELSSTSLMLMQLLPIIRRIDPEWAQKLEQDNAELRQLAVQQADRPQEMRVMARIGGPDADDGPPRDMREEMTSMQVDELAQRDPQQALKMSNEINDPVLRATSQARISGELQRSDPAQAAALLKSARQALAQASKPQDKLMILTGLAQAQAAMKDSEGLADTVKTGFTIGEEIFRKGLDKRSNAPLFAQPGYELMNRLTTISAKADAQATIMQLDDLRTPVLQSMLLVTAARAINPDAGPDGPGMMIEIED